MLGQKLIRSNQEDFDIFYSINSGGDLPYTGTLTLTETSHVYPYAKVTVDGVDYKSIVNKGLKSLSHFLKLCSQLSFNKTMIR